MSDDEHYYEDHDVWVEKKPNLFSIEKCSNEKFIEMIEKGYDINQQNSRGWTLLGYLMSKLNLEKIDILLRYNPDVTLQNESGRNIFFGFYGWICKKTYLDMVDRIIALDTTGELIKSKSHNGFTSIAEYRHEWEYFKGKYDDCCTDKYKKYYHKKVAFLEILIIKLKNHVLIKKSLFMMMLPDLEGNNKKRRVY